MYPKESQHVEHAEVYRATKSSDCLKVDDFLPSNIEYKNQRDTFRGQINQPFYSVSVFTDLDSLKKKVESFPALDGKIGAYAKGFTTIKRGISFKENSDHHVNYFLYDYENNSPKDDFQIIEVR